jgi:hypothetical protein
MERLQLGRIRLLNSLPDQYRLNGRFFLGFFAYPNAYPIVGERAEIGRVSGGGLIEKEALSPKPFAYELGGRRFESCRAHHRISDLRRTRLGTNNQSGRTLWPQRPSGQCLAFWPALGIFALMGTSARR